MPEWINERLQAGGGLVKVGRDPRLRQAVHRARVAGLLTRLLPGIYCLPESATDFEIRVKALYLHAPDAVLTGRAAARAWWPDLDVPIIEATRRGSAAPASGFRWSQRVIPLDDTIDLPGGARATGVAATVLDLVAELGGTVIDEALRLKVVTLAAIRQALSSRHRSRGNALRRHLVEDSRDQPWSEAERLFHRILREARLPWRFETNFHVESATGVRALDAALPELKLAFEIDGYEYHGTRRAFVRDRKGDITLSRAGWSTHRLAATTVEDERDWVLESVCELTFARAAELGIAPRQVLPRRRGAA